ncbi:MAG: hypothetical protein QNJ60_08970 [Xenococcaceae cyanobacterium MO_188.B19]|nr:hypothetical protein [Xenococcaceae cyanobacterium MO_188.B19]
MQQPWQTLNTILDSVTALQEDQYHSIDSLEIKESAKSFETSLQPCLKELSESSTRLTLLLENSLKELEQAEAIWLSKARIANTDTFKIWEQLTILTGYSLKIKQLGNEFKATAIDKAEIACQKIFKKLIKKYFSDSKKGIKEAVSWGDKTKLNKAIKPNLNIYEDKLNTIISEQLRLFFESLKKIDFQYLFYSYSLFDKYQQKQYIARTKVILNKIDDNISYPNYLDNTIFLKMSNSFDYTLNDWQKRFGDIYYREVCILKLKVINNSKTRINKIVDDRVELALSIIEEMIAFYSELLEKQNRYCKETSEQRLAEKHWIDKQKETLGKMQTDISCILEYNNEFLNES